MTYIIYNIYIYDIFLKVYVHTGIGEAKDFGKWF